MNASLLLELAKEWQDLASLARVSGCNLEAMGLGELELEAAAIARRAIVLAGALEELARRHAEESRRD